MASRLPVRGSFAAVIFDSTEAKLKEVLGEPVISDPPLATVLDLADVVPPEKLLGAREWQLHETGLVLRVQFPLDGEDETAHEMHISGRTTTDDGIHTVLDGFGLPVPESDAWLIEHYRPGHRVTHFAHPPGDLIQLDYTVERLIDGTIAVVASAYAWGEKDSRPPWTGTRIYKGRWEKGAPHRTVDPGSAEARDVVPPQR